MRKGEFVNQFIRERADFNALSAIDRHRVSFSLVDPLRLRNRYVLAAEKKQKEQDSMLFNSHYLS